MEKNMSTEKTEGQMSDEERLAQKLDAAFLKVWGGSRVRSAYVHEYADQTSRDLALEFLAKARELLCPAAKLEGRREAFEAVGSNNWNKCKACASETKWSPIHRFCGECGANLETGNQAPSAGSGRLCEQNGICGEG
jgi:NADH pyrophosphatase NudC (nudix superfamily)